MAILLTHTLQYQDVANTPDISWTIDMKICSLYKPTPLVSMTKACRSVVSSNVTVIALSS